MYRGFIKKHRKILAWEWYTNVNTNRLFDHLLLTANYKDKKWQGITIKKGQVLTGIKKLSVDTGLSVQQIRTALKNLKSTNEITIKSTSQYSIITLTNFNSYNTEQQDEQQAYQQAYQQTSNKPSTSEQQTSNKRATTTNKKKKEKKVKKEEKEKNMKRVTKTLVLDTENKKTANRKTWLAYSAAYKKRYGVDPVRNAKVNSQIAQFVKRVGADEAPQIAEFFLLSHNSYYIARGHSVDVLVADAEKNRTEWATGRHQTQIKARDEERLIETGNSWQNVIDKMKAEGTLKDEN